MITILCVMALLSLVAIGCWLLSRDKLQLEPAEVLAVLMLLALLDESERS